MKYILVYSMAYGILSVCFFLSGAAALSYEVIWVRILALTFGNTVYAVGAVLSAFMAGLSLGSYLFGRWADRGANLLKGYGFLEAGIALFAFFSPELLEYSAGLYLSFASPDTAPWASVGLKFGLGFIVLIVPTTLMGGTLPVLSRHFINTDEELGRKLGRLYSLNTIGGALGAFLVGFFFIRLFGLEATLRATAFINALIGAVSFLMGSKIKTTAESAVETPLEDLPGARPGYKFALIAFTLSGFLAMVYEVAWSRLLVTVIGSATYSFSLILMGFLMGIALGSLAVSRLPARLRPGLAHFSAIQVLIGITAFATISLFNVLPHLMLKGLSLTKSSYSGVLAFDFLVVLIFILVPTTLMGAVFPVIAAVFGAGERHRGRSIRNHIFGQYRRLCFRLCDCGFFPYPHCREFFVHKGRIGP